MSGDTTFGAQPEQLGQLFAIGLDKVDSGEDVAQITRWDLLKEKPGNRIGPYELTRVLGEGGMGIVYLAVQEHPVRRQTALKIIKPGMDSRRVIARFEAERQTLALLDHPHIAHVLDAGTTDSGLPYFVMEYVEGQPITEYCDRNRLSIEDRLRLFVQVCQAVHHAHQKGFIHRDIKPSNILVAVQDGRPVPKVIDFGVARALGQPLTQETLSTQEGQLIGTPEYMSPEQIDLAHEGADTRSDVYSLGVLLYVLLAGVLPFESEALREGGLEHLRRLVREQDPKTPSTRLTGLGKKATEAAAHRQTDVRTLARELHRELEWIPLKAMRKEREQRYRSAAELADDIQNYLNGDPLIAGPPSRLYRARKFVRRHRASVIATVIVGLTIAVGVALSLAMYIRAQVQTEQASAVSDLLSNTVLRALDPYREQGGEVTAQSVLDAVAAGVEGRFRNAPLIEADIRNRLGRTYEADGQYDKALQHLQRALDIRRRKLGDHDPLTIDSMYRVAWTLTCTGRAREAEPLFLDVVAEYARQFGEEDLRTISAKRMLADNYLSLGDRGTATRMYQEVLGTARRALGSGNEVAVMATFRMGNMNAALGHYDEAEGWYREAFQSSVRGLGPDHGVTRLVEGSLGHLYMLQGRYPEAERALTESVSHLRVIYGEHHGITHEKVRGLIQLYALWDRPEEARQWRSRLSGQSADAASLEGSVRYDQASDTYAIRGSGMNIADVFDEFHFAHKTLQGDGSVTARIDSIEDTNPRTISGIMIRRTLEPTSEHASIYIIPGSRVVFQYRSTPRGAASMRYNGRESAELPHWVRLTRRADILTAEHSSDGTSWQEVRSLDPNESAPVRIAMDETVQVGLVVTSRDVGRAATACIADVRLTGNVSPAWPFTVSDDIGLQTLRLPTGEHVQMASADSNEPGVGDSSLRRLRFIDGELSSEDVRVLTLRHGCPVGSTRYDQATGTYTMVGAGSDVWNTSDQFHFAWKKLDGDGSITARIDRIQPVTLWTKAGVMMRNAMTSDSEYASVFITPAHQVWFQSRLAAGQITTRIGTDANAVGLPHWVRLVRKGNTFEARHSRDGIHWKVLEGRDFLASAPEARPAVAEIQMKGSVHVGLAVTSRTGSATAEAKMSNLTVTGDVQPPGEFLLSEDIGFQMIMLPKK